MSESVYVRMCHKIGTTQKVLYLNICKQSVLIEPKETYIIGLKLNLKKMQSANIYMYIEMD